MIKRLLPLAVAAALGLAGTAYGMTKDEYKAENDRISQQHKTAKKTCNDTLKGNAKDICVTEADGNQKVAKAELEASYKDTSKNRLDARLAKADADYNVAKERCDDQAGNAKDVCKKDAKAAHTRAQADARADRKVGDAKSEANEKVADARRDAAEDKRDANYAAAKERCDALSGNAKDSCIAQAKTRFGVK